MKLVEQPLCSDRGDLKKRAVRSRLCFHCLDAAPLHVLYTYVCPTYVYIYIYIYTYMYICMYMNIYKVDATIPDGVLHNEC